MRAFWGDLDTRRTKEVQRRGREKRRSVVRVSDRRAERAFRRVCRVVGDEAEGSVLLRDAGRVLRRRRAYERVERRASREGVESRILKRDRGDLVYYSARGET